MSVIEETYEEDLVARAHDFFSEFLDELIKGLEKENEQTQSR